VSANTVSAPVNAAPVGGARLRDLARVLWPFVPQLAVAPVLFFVGVTFLHEAAHAAVAIALGGTVTEFAFLPGPHNLGHVRWEPPPHAPAWLGELVSVAPYVMWALLAAATVAFARFRGRVNRWLAAAIFFWCYFIPIGDIAWNLYGGRGDLAVGGMDGLLLQAVGTVALVVAFGLGYSVQRRLFGARAVGVRGYLACAAVIGAGSALAAGIGMLAFSALAST
jgi:hypothetical protein